MEATCFVLIRSMEFACSDSGKSAKNFSQDRQFPGRDLNLEPPDYKAGMLPTRRQRSVTVFLNDIAADFFC
jgi:hypothetical protein